MIDCLHLSIVVIFNFYFFPSVLSSSVRPVSSAAPDSQWAIHKVSFLNSELSKFFSHSLEPLEHGLSILCCNLLDSSTSDSPSVLQQREYIIVGTAFAIPGESEPSRGRILVFKVDRDAGISKGASVAVDYDTIDDHAM